MQMVAGGETTDQIIDEYPYIDAEDPRQVLAYAAVLGERVPPRAAFVGVRLLVDESLSPRLCLLLTTLRGGAQFASGHLANPTLSAARAPARSDMIGPRTLAGQLARELRVEPAGRRLPRAARAV